MAGKKRPRKLLKRKRPQRRRTPPTLESGSARSRSDDRDDERYERRRPKRKKKSRLRRYVIRTALGIAAVFVLMMAWFFYSLPSIDDLNKFTKAPSILIKSEDGQIIGSSGDIYGDYISFSELPSSLVDAVVATEDRNFYHHFGVDPFGLLRATVANIRARHVVQGGSTITQQVAKNVFLTPERSFKRKLKEMLLALKLERRFSKEDIMSIYLNRVYLGAGNYGVDAASHRYFDKSARELTLPESAIVAGLLKAPSRFAPTSNPTLSRNRATQVIVNMQDAGYLTEQQSIKAREDLFRSMADRKRNTQSTYYFSDWILDQIPEYVGNVTEDIVVTTTLNTQWQAMAEKAVTEVMDKEGSKHDATQASLLAMTPDGAIHAMIGGRSYAQSQYNRATQSLRQPGSSFKLFVYLSGLEDGMTPESIVEDHPVSVKISGGYWQPHNYTNKYLGTIPLKEAVTHSVNTVAVQVAERVGLEQVIAMARRLGVDSDLEPLPSIALGSTEVTLLEMTTAYAHLASNGAIVHPYGISEITTVKGQPIFMRNTVITGAVLRPNIVGMMNEMLLNVVTNGTAKAAQIGRPVAGKTGTTSDYRDAWFMGYTPDLVAGVWVGNDDNTPMKKVTGGMMPAQIWHDFMQAALANVPARNIPTDGSASPNLPWQTEAPEFPTQPNRLQTNDNAAPEEDKVHLGRNFWDKLMR